MPCRVFLRTGSTRGVGGRAVPPAESVCGGVWAEEEDVRAMRSLSESRQQVEVDVSGEREEHRDIWTQPALEMQRVSHYGR